MKKQILFFAAFLMSASALFAQQTQFYTNNPFFTSQTNQWATTVSEVEAPDMSGCVDCRVPQVQTQTYNAWGQNNSMINQTGEQNNGNAFQDGDENYSAIVQDGADNYTGVGAVSAIGGALNDAQVYQTGSRNYSDVGQHGDNNNSDVIQVGTDNYAKQLVGGGWAEENVTYVRQIGNGNASSQTQWLDGNTARVEQLTNNNDATQVQTSTDSHTADTGNYASIMQYGGDENAAIQTQTGNFNIARDEQNGSRNISNTTQMGTPGSEIDDISNNSYTYQNGDDNLACVNQKATDGYNLSAIYQLGNSNKAGVTQNTSGVIGNFSYITQLGNFNTASVTQINGISQF